MFRFIFPMLINDNKQIRYSRMSNYNKFGFIICIQFCFMKLRTVTKFIKIVLFTAAASRFAR